MPVLVLLCAKKRKARFSPFSFQSSHTDPYLDSLPCFPLKNIAACCFLAHFQCLMDMWLTFKCLIFTIFVSPCIFLQPLCIISLHFSTPTDSIFVTVIQLQVYFACAVHTTPISTLAVHLSLSLSKLGFRSFRIWLLHSLHLSSTAKESNLQPYNSQHLYSCSCCRTTP